MAGGASGQEPPDTADDDDEDDEEDGAEAGCFRLLLEPEVELVEVEPELELVEVVEVVEVVDRDDDLAARVLVVLWPWKDLAAATDTAAVTRTAPATIQRLIRPISVNPASLALTAFLLTPGMFGGSCKKTLNQM